MANEVNYLHYVDQVHNRINSKDLGIVEPLENHSSSELYSDHRLRSSSTEKEETLKFEETQGKLYVVKKIDDINTVKIPQLDLENIISKQKRKMYPYNINTQGELIENPNKESSIDTYNDEDAFICWKDNEEESEESKNGEGDKEGKNSNLFNSSFFSDLSSVKHSTKEKNKPKPEEKYEEIKKEKEEKPNDVIMINDNQDEGMDNHNSFLDQELNIDSINFEKEIESISMIKNETGEDDKAILEKALGNIDKSHYEREDEYSQFSGIQKDISPERVEVRENNFMRNHKIKNKLNDLVNKRYEGNFNQILGKDEDDKQIDNEKPKSLPPKERSIEQDHMTFGKDSSDTMENKEEEKCSGFDKILMKDKYKSDYESEETKLRNKSVVIPRSSILLKNKKNIQKRNIDINNSKSLK
jgi:hypothetical protein